MYSAIANDTFSYILTMKKFKEQNPDTSWIKITTITMVSSLSSETNIQKIREVFEKMGSIKLTRTGGESFEWKLKTTTFFNQITLVYVDKYSTKSVKLFPNGSIQVAGCTDLFDCNRVIQQICYLVGLITNKTIEKKNFRVVMINSNFSLNYKVNLHETAHHFSKNEIFDTTFDPDRYSAVKIKFKPAEDMKQVTVSIFGTGKIIVTGAETLKEIVFAYNIINQHISINNKIKYEKADTIDSFDSIFGYNISDIVTFLEQKKFSAWNYTKTNYGINF